MTAKKKTAREHLHEIQKQLKAPKNQYNDFGKYKYRSCEDILEGVKSILPEGATVVISDALECVGQRYYIKATAEFAIGDGVVAATGYAREQENKKGMDESQITGSASSYARKYALNGLFAIDDTADADSDESGGDKGKSTTKKKEPEQKEPDKPEPIFKSSQERTEWLKSAKTVMESFKTEADIDKFIKQNNDKYQALGVKQQKWLKDLIAELKAGIDDDEIPY